MKSNNKYNEKRYHIKKNIYHWCLAFQQIRLNLILLVLFLPIVAVTIEMWMNIDFLLALFEAPKIILPIYEIAIKSFGVIIPIILVWSVIETIEALTARKDEASIILAFKENELKNGKPIIIYKNKDKTRGYIRRVWYSPIPLNVWIENQDRIEHQMSETIIKELDYEEKAKDNRIVMISVKGMKQVTEEKPFLDNELEKDMERI